MDADFLPGVSLELSQWFSDFEATFDRQPMETTLTEQLAMMLSANATVELNTGSAESRNGYDFKIAFQHEDQSCILYMQAKIVEDGVVDFIADYGKVANGIVELLQPERLHRMIDHVRNQEDEDTYVGGGYIIYGYDGGVRYVPIAHVRQAFMGTGGEDINDGERRRQMTAVINEQELWMDLSGVLTDRTEVPEYEGWVEFVQLGDDEEDGMDDDDDDDDDDWP